MFVAGVLGVLFGAVLLLWWPMARSRAVGWSVAAAIVAVAVATGIACSMFRRGWLELTFFGLILALLLVTAGWLVERRRLGAPARPIRVRGPYAVMVGLVLVIVCCGGAIGQPTPFLPSVDTVMPLPDGLASTVSEGGCGSGACVLYIATTPRPGQSMAALQDEVSAHLVTRGWDTPCHRVGWLIDTGSACAHVTPGTGGRLIIELSGSRHEMDPDGNIIPYDY